MESVPLTTSDGHELAADLLCADGPTVGGVVVCHPHPQHGGNRFNPIVDAIWRTLPGHGWTAIRFDFRAEFDHGVGERLDVVAAIDEIERRVDGPIVVVGYSFGAIVGLATADERVAATVAVAPPLTAMPIDPPRSPALAIIPRHDQFTAPEAAAAVVADWPDVGIEVIESTDHFLVGRAAFVAETAARWLAERFPPSNDPPAD